MEADNEDQRDGDVSYMAVDKKTPVLTWKEDYVAYKMGLWGK